MTHVFSNLKLLKQDMENKGWIVDSFYFRYKSQNYIVLVKLYEPNEVKPEYALLKLEFLKENDFTDSLLVHANSVKLFVDAKTLREFFDIAFNDNLGDILKQFNHRLSEVIPIEVIEDKPQPLKEAMIASLNKSDPKDPRKKYCYAVRRNPKKEDGSLGQRSPFNDNKTRIRRPDLYNRLGIETNLSFRYSINSEDEKTDEEIISNWTKNQNK